MVSHVFNGDLRYLNERCNVRSHSEANEIMKAVLWTSNNKQLSLSNRFKDFVPF